MKKPIGRYKAIGYAVIVGMVMNHSQVGHAGWTAGMNGVGFGWASVDVKSSTGFIGRAVTPMMDEPSASMAPSPDEYFANAELPQDASSATVARLKGFAGYIYQALTIGSYGDKTGSADIDAMVDVPSSDCASLTISSSLIASNLISVDAVGSLGSAVLLRVYQLPEGQVPPSDILATTNIDESLDFVKTLGTNIFTFLALGPFHLTQSNCNAIVIPINGNVTNLYFIADGEAKSNPLTIICPSNVVFTCAGPTNYPVQINGGCGTINVAFSPPANLLPLGVMTNVTVTATDQLTNVVQCTFTAIRQSSLAFGAFEPPLRGLEGTDCTKEFKKSELTSLGQVVPIKFTTFCNGTNYSGVPPTYEIERCSDHVIVKTGSFEFVSFEWHAQWDSGEQGSGVTAGQQFVIRVILPDGTTQTAAMKFKNR